MTAGLTPAAEADSAADEKTRLWDRSWEVAPEGRTAYYFGMDSSWSVPAVLPLTGNPTLYMYEDQELAATSRHRGSEVELIAINCVECSWSERTMFPVVKNAGGTSIVGLANWHIWGIDAGEVKDYSIGENALATTWHVHGLMPGKEYTFTVSGGGDADIYLFFSEQEAKVEYQTADDAVAFSNSAPTGGVESLTFTSEITRTSSYAFVLIQKSGSGEYEVSLLEA